MLATLKVTDVDKVANEDNSVSINVKFDLLSEGETLQSSALSFPSTHTKDQIQAELKSFLDAFNKQREAELAAQVAANEVAAVDQVVNDLTGLEVTSDETTETQTPAEGEATTTQ